VRTHVALLRGINVGGRNKVAMADLRAVMTSLGHADVATYIQSGNVVFSTAQADNAALAAAIESAIAEACGVAPHVVVVSRAELAALARANPYPAEDNLKNVHVVFLAEDPGPGQAEAVADASRRAAEKGSRDTAEFVGRALFLHTPDGFGRSVLAELLARANGPMAARAAGTARNLATVTALLALCED
jgi:uncharacterized protein (DUF1697 family)